MDQIPQWVWLLLSPLTGGFGAWVGVRVAVAVLNEQMTSVKEDVKRHERRIGQLNEDSLTHDFEIEGISNVLKLPRARRQPLRDWET